MDNLTLKKLTKLHENHINKKKYQLSSYFSQIVSKKLYNSKFVIENLTTLYLTFLFAYLVFHACNVSHGEQILILKILHNRIY